MILCAELASCRCTVIAITQKLYVIFIIPTVENLIIVDNVIYANVCDVEQPKNEYNQQFILMILLKFCEFIPVVFIIALFMNVTFFLKQ